MRSLAQSLGLVALLACGAAVAPPRPEAPRPAEPVPGPAESRVLAFPGAEGFGRHARGGRGGRVLYVTHLGDSGPGSLRAAVEASGPRVILFETGGTITLEAPLVVREPYLTLAGQSAPGGGIALRNGGRVTEALLQIETHDVVVRHLRSRPGPDRSPQGSCCLDALMIRGNDVIVDHVSLSWSVDEVASISGDGQGVTLQWSIVAEGLACSNHRETLSGEGGRDRPCPGRRGGPHNFGMTISTFPGESYAPGRVSLHHNLWAHLQGRFPNITSNTLVDVANNVFYDFLALSKLGPKTEGWQVRANFVNNVYRPGPNTPPNPRLFTVVPMGRDPIRVHVAGNDVPGDMLNPAERHGVTTGAPFATEPVALTDTATAYEQVLAGAGATLPERDAVDARLVEEVRRGTGSFVDDPSEVGGWPTLAAGTAPPDGDGDGMPDAWERANGLDPAVDDGARDADGDGYTSLEESLNATDPRAAEGGD